mgnify:FL=1
MIEDRLNIAIYARKFVIQEATGSFTFTNSFLYVPKSLEKKFSISLIFKTKKDVQDYKSAFPNCKKQLFSLCQYQRNLTSPKLSQLDSLKFRIGAWIKKLLDQFFLKIELVHPSITNDFLKMEKLSMEQLVDRNQIDLIVYPFWFDYPTINRPYIIFYWDAAHRYLSFMPDMASRNDMQVEAVFKPALENAFKVIVPNNAAVVELEALYKVGIPESKYSIIPFVISENTNTENNEELSIYDRFAIKDSYLFIPAGFWPHKNHKVVIDAVKILNERGIQLEVVMTGPDRGNYQYIQDLIKKSDLKEQFHYLGFVDRSELISLYKNAFAMVFSSIVGPNNYPPIEAASHGCPVILSDLTGHREQMGESALYFDKFNPNELADQIQLLKENNALREGLIQAGKKLVKGLEPSKYFDQLENVFDEFKNYRLLWGDRYSLK